ncbi:MAG TPA: hypothetical protein VGL71_04490, partial [Urbifossiella sp.]
YSGPITGTINGANITADVQAERDAVFIRNVIQDAPQKAFEIRLSDPDKVVEGANIVVKPDQAAGPDVPNVIVYDPSLPEPRILTHGYALTLSLGKRDKGKVSGRVSLNTPDDKHSFVAGTFTAEWLRAREEPPGPEDAPFVQGTITVKGIAEPNVNIGYIRVDPVEPAISNALGTVIGPSGIPIRSDNDRPRAINLFPATMKDPARFEFTRLDPGRYWIFAKTNGGPGAWKWITVAPGSQQMIDFAIDTTVFGGIDVTAPGTTEAISIVPAGEPGKPWPDSVIATAASIINLRLTGAALPKADAGKPLIVNVPRLSPGKYEVFAGELSAAVEIKANEIAKVELKKK